MPLPLHSGIWLSYADPSLHGVRSRPVPRSLLLTCLALNIVCIACGGTGSGTTPAQLASVSVQPNSAQVFVGGKTHFSAVVQNAPNSAVTWAVQEASGVSQNLGTIDPSGNYVAPNASPSTATVTVTVTATLQSDSSVSGSATVSIQSALAISPARAGLTTSQALPMNVVTPGVGAADVAWSVDGVANGNSSVGLISAAGGRVTYTPPTTAGSHTIAASLIANANVTGQATVYVTDFAGTFTWRNDNARSGINSQELALSRTTVNSSTFGKLFSCAVDGYVYAEPLYVANLAIPGNGTHNVVFVATENDSVYAFDADASPCETLWQTNLVAPLGQQAVFAPDLLQTANPSLGPLIGVTGTPVISTSAEAPYLYVVAASQTLPAQTGSNYAPPSYFHWLCTLNLATGQQELRLSGAQIGAATLQGPQFASAAENQRAALLLESGVVYIAFGAYGENSTSYLGWLFGYDAGSLTQTDAFHVVADPPGGGIWQSGGGPSADGNHNVFVATGDGPPNSGVSYSDSVVRLTTDGGLSVADYFTPCDQGAGWPNTVLESQSSAPLLLAYSAGSPSQTRHLLISGTKEGLLYVINTDPGMMGEFLIVNCSDSRRVQAIDVGGPIFSTPLYWNNALYLAPGQRTASESNYLVSLLMSGGVLQPPASQSRETFGPQGATPVLSANGTSNAVLWLIDTSGAFAMQANNGPALQQAILRAYDPNDLSKELYDSTQAPNQRDMAGPAVKFTVPTVANGKVYVGTQNELDVYGLLP
jgi:hypothetical protein